MIAKMTQYSFILLHGDKEQFLSELQALGLVDIQRSAKPVDSYSQGLLDSIATLRHDIECTEKGMDDTLDGLLAVREALAADLKDATPWGEYDRERLAAFDPHFYRVATKKFNPAWQERYALQTVSDEGGYRYFVILGDTAGFPLKEISAPQRSPSELKQMLAQQEEKIENHRKVLEARKEDIPHMQHHIRNL